MKLQLMSLIISAGLLASCGSTYQTTSANAAMDVPANIQSSFTVQYPDATEVTWGRYDAAVVPIDWELTGWQPLDANDYAVTFKMGNETYYSWYDSDGTWVGATSTLTDHARLPYAVNNYIKTKYPDYTITKIDREIWKGNTAYEVKLKKTDDDKVKLLISENGTILKEKPTD
jgi:hypothetical protein